MKKIALVMVLMLCGCRGLSTADLRPNIEPNNNKVVKLEPVVSLSNLESVYRYWKGKDASASIENNADYMPVVSARYQNHRVNDTVELFQRQVVDVVSSREGAKKGTISLTLGHRKTDTSISLQIVSWLFLKVPCLIGFPSNNVEDTLEVRVEIKDLNGNTVKYYSEEVTNDAYVAMYWGASSRGAYRKVANANLKQALNNISEQINADAAEINKKLK